MSAGEGAKGGFPAGSAWSGEARAVLEKATARHGGWAAYAAFGIVSFRPKQLRGLLPTLKGLGKTFVLPPRIDIAPRERRAVFHDYPLPGQRGLYSSGKVALVGENGAMIETHADIRKTFVGARRWQRWSAADALYFFGYALTHYCSLPFTLAEGTPLGLRRTREAGRALTGVEVQLPPNLDTHSARQTFYFDDEGLLRRHDYVADIVGPWARGAHYADDYQTVAGVPMAQRRHVVGRIGRWPTPVVALHAELEIASEPAT
jgi:hypothetical protein